MEVSDVVQEEATHPPKARPINSCRGATLEAPLSITVVGQDRVGVVEVSDHDEPVGNTNPRNVIVFANFTEAPDIRTPPHGSDHSHDTSVGHQDGIALTGSEQNGAS